MGKYNDAMCNYLTNPAAVLPEKCRTAGLDDETIDTIGVMTNKDMTPFKSEDGGFEMCKAFEDMKQEGIEIGLSQGIFESYKELGASLEDAISKVISKFGMSREEAEAAAKQYWQ